jgi:uncharacterized membrane protein YesL
MNKLPASAGWQWIKDGWNLFRQQPGALVFMFISFYLAVILLSIIPILGQIAGGVVMAVFWAGFMQACANVERGVRLTPQVMRVGLQQPAFKWLAGLGLLYLFAGALAVGATWLVDGGALISLMLKPQQPNQAALAQPGLVGALLTGCVVYLLAAMAFCFAPPLILWQRMSLGKAIFFSFFGIVRALKAFAVFMLGWLGIFLLLAQLMGLLLGGSTLARLLVAPLVMTMLVVFNCALYAAYRQLFGAPPEPAPV